MRLHSSVPVSLLLAAALLCCYPLSLVVPPQWAWENGIIEDGDVVVLGIGFAWALVAWLGTRQRQAALLARCVVPVWAILIGRELSWGAVLFAPASMTAAGPVFTSHDLWYRPFVTPVLVALAAWSAWSAVRCRLDCQLHAVLASGRFPWPSLLVVLAAAVGSTCAEGHLTAWLAVPHAQRFEELVELVGYCALVAVQAQVLGERLAASRATESAAAVPAR